TLSPASLTSSSTSEKGWPDRFIDSIEGTKRGLTQTVPSLSATQNHATYVNPQWVRLLDLLQLNTRYVRCAGVELFTGDGDVILDFLSGYCVHNTGHNHPYIVEQLRDELSRSGPAMLQSHVQDLAGDLAKRLCRLAGVN